MNRLGVALLLLLSLPSWGVDESRPWTLHFGGFTHHWRNAEDYNNVNLGLGVEYSFSDKSSVMVGAFRNSQYRTAEYLYLHYEPFRIRGIRFGAMGGVVNHYDMDDGRFIASALLTATVAVGRFEVGVVGFPNVRNVDGCISLQLGYNF
jgi:hypothetical protein